MASLAPYLASHLVRSLARGGAPGRMPHAERAPAGLLLSDISGFTALTERLQARGREGAEEIATINAAFAPAIRAIEGQGGSIVSFGGDALFAIFTGSGPVHRARAAAATIRARLARASERETSTGRVTLRIGQAVHHGRLSLVHLGSAGRRHHLVTGRAVAELARLQARATDDIPLLSAAAERWLRQERGQRPPSSRGGGVAPAKLLREYLPAPIVSQLSGFAGEYRNGAIVFLETEGARLATLQRFYLRLGAVLDRYGGLLLKSDLSPQGTRWLCVFGIPRAHEEDPDRAARAALDIIAPSPGLPPRRGGLHHGTFVNLTIGTPSRRSFDIMGDAVNTAARALSQARWGEVIVTEETRTLLSGVETRSRGAHAVKGKARPMTLHALRRAHGMSRPIRVASAMVGREAEMRAVIDALERAQAGSGCVIGVKGHAGIGKSSWKRRGRRRRWAFWSTRGARSPSGAGPMAPSASSYGRHSASPRRCPAIGSTSVWRPVRFTSGSRLGI